MNWGQTFRDVRTLSVDQAGQFLFRKVGKRWRVRRAQRSAKRQIARLESDLESALSTGQELPGFLGSKFSMLDGFPVTPAQKQMVADHCCQEYRSWVEQCLKTADDICENRITILGREIRVEGKVNWHEDYVSGIVWPLEIRAKSRKESQSQGGDIKFVWELSRFHHGVTLGRAFALTGDERFARKFFSMFSDWRQANPPQVGPNWRCAMEVAIRAVNLLWAGSLLASSKAFNLIERESFVRSLLTHGVFIFHNLEYTERAVGRSVQPVNGNHYMADLAGLIYISCALHECRVTSDWRLFAQQEFFREIRLQVDDEGVHWEYSPGYHRLVLEMVLGCLILLESVGVAIPEDIRTRTVKMLEFIRHYRKPSGGVPLVRDLDSGRFCILGDEELSSHDHLLALGAIYFDKPDLYPGKPFEDCFWYLGQRAIDWHGRRSRMVASTTNVRQGQPARSSFALLDEDDSGSVPSCGNSPDLTASLPASVVHSPGSRLYEQSGFCVMREQSHYLFAVCCPKGMRGYCGHTHNDFLSFELEAYGRPFLTDCGSYVYTQSAEWRNRFRSVASHNTVVVDGTEQNQFNSSDLFEIDSCVRPIIREWKSDSMRDVLEAYYSLLLPDGSRVTHERRIVFAKDRGLWLIKDRVVGTGRHLVETRFHFAEGISIAGTGDGLFRTLCPAGPNLSLIALGPTPVAGQIESGWVSSAYAVKEPICVLRFVGSMPLPFEQCYLLAPAQHDASGEDHSYRERKSLEKIASHLFAEADGLTV